MPTSLSISSLLAFGAGIASFLSPCILPLIPAYITYLTGSSVQSINDKREKIKLLSRAIGFIIGFSIVFIIFGASASALGRILQENQDIYQKLSGVIIIGFGIHLMGLIKLPFLYREKRWQLKPQVSGFFTSIPLGMAFAAGWSPCVGPILGSILIYASASETITLGVYLLGLYSLGLALPFLLTALTIQWFSKFMVKFSRFLPMVSVFSGVVLIVLGVLIYTNNFQSLSAFLA